MIEQKEIKQTIKKWFKEFTNKNIIDNDNFVKNGYIDSFKFLNLIMFLEKSYDLEISKEFLQNNNNYTLEKISAEVLKNING